MKKTFYYLSVVFFFLSATPCFSAQSLTNNNDSSNISNSSNIPAPPEETLYTESKGNLLPQSIISDTMLIEYDDGKNYLEAVLKSNEKSHSEDQPKKAFIMKNLGITLYALSQYNPAKGYLEKALAINKERCGKDHPETASTMKNLGRVLCALHQYESAKKYLDEALKIYTTHSEYGPDHPETARTMTHLGRVLYAQGQHKNAQNYLEKAIAIKETTFALRSLAAVLTTLSDYKEARKCYERVFKICVKKYGAYHAKTKQATYELDLHDTNYAKMKK